MIKWKQVKDLKEGDLVSETIIGSTTSDIIIKNGDRISINIIQKLSDRGIDWISVYEDIDVETGLSEIFTDEKLEKFSVDLSKVCDETLKDGRIDVKKTKQISDEINGEIIKSYGEYVVPTLVKLKRMDDYTFSHQVNVAIIGTILATERFGKKKEIIEKYTMGGLLHDMGKLWIPPEIIKSREKLQDYEFNIIKKHPEYGYKIAVESAISDVSVLNAIRYHHEKWNGKGYANSLQGEDIPLEGRMLMVADVFDALTTIRPYKEAWQPYEAVSFIVKQAKTMFDPDVVRLFLRSFGLYPVNTKVRISTGEIGIVIGNKRGAVSRPVITVIREGKQQQLDLSKEKGIIIKEVIKIRRQPE